MQNAPPFPVGGLTSVGIAGPGFQQGGPMPPQNEQSCFVERPPSSVNSGMPPQFGQYGPCPPQPPGIPSQAPELPPQASRMLAPGQVRPLLPELAGRPGRSESEKYDPEQPDDDDDEDSRYDQFDREIPCHKPKEPPPQRYGREYNQEPYRYESGGEAEYYDEVRRRDRQGRGMLIIFISSLRFCRHQQHVFQSWKFMRSLIHFTVD